MKTVIVITLLCINALTLVILTLNLVTPIGLTMRQRVQLKNISGALDYELQRSISYLQSRAYLIQVLETIYIPVAQVANTVECELNVRNQLPALENATTELYQVVTSFDSNVTVSFTAVETQLAQLAQAMNNSGVVSTYSNGTFDIENNTTEANYTVSSINGGGCEIFYVGIPVSNLFYTLNNSYSEVAFNGIVASYETGYDGMFDAQLIKVASAPRNANFQTRIYTNGTLYFAQGTLLSDSVLGVRYNVTMPIALV